MTQRFGGTDIVFNNAGVAAGGPVERSRSLIGSG